MPPAENATAATGEATDGQIATQSPGERQPRDHERDALEGRPADEGTLQEPERSQLADGEKGKRKQDPHYHVLLIDEDALKQKRLVGELLTDEDKPVRAPNRNEATEEAKDRPELKADDVEIVEHFLVIPARELQIVTRRTKRQTQTVASFE